MTEQHNKRSTITHVLFFMISILPPIIVWYTLPIILPTILDIETDVEYQIIDIDKTIIDKARELGIKVSILNGTLNSEPIITFTNKADVLDILDGSKAIYLIYDDRYNEINITYIIVKDEGIYSYTDVYEKPLIGRMINITDDEVMVEINHKKQLESNVWIFTLVTGFLSVTMAAMIAISYKDD